MYRPNAVKATRGSPRKAAGWQQCGRLSQRLHHPLQLLQAHPQCHPLPISAQTARLPAHCSPPATVSSPRAFFWPQVYHPHGKASRLEDDNPSRRQPHLPLRDAGGADLLQDLLELGIAHLCQKLPLWQHHIPAVVLYEVKRLVYGLQHMGDRIGTPSPACQLLVMPNTCRGFRHAGI